MPQWSCENNHLLITADSSEETGIVEIAQA